MGPVVTMVGELPADSDDFIDGLAFSNDGNLLAAKSVGGAIEIWAWKERRLVSRLNLLSNANDRLVTERISFSPDDRYLASCHSNTGVSVISMWETKGWLSMPGVSDPNPGSGCTSFGFSPDSKMIYRVLLRHPFVSGNTLIAHSTQTWQEAWGVDASPLRAMTLAVSPDGAGLAVGGQLRNSPGSGALNSLLGDNRGGTSVIVVIDVNTQKLVKTFAVEGEINQFSRLLWSPDSQRLTLGSALGIQSFSLQSGAKKVHVAPTPFATAHMSLRYAMAGEFLVEASVFQKNSATQIFKTHPFDLVQTINGDAAAIAVTADGKHVALAQFGSTTIWQFNLAMSTER